MGKKSKKKKKNIKSESKSISSSASSNVPAINSVASKKKRSNIMMAVIFFIILGAMLYAISFASQKDPVVIGVPNWRSGDLTAIYLQEQISKQFDVPVVLKYENDNSGLDNEEIYEKVASGEFDMHPETWTPLHKKTIYKYGGDVVLSESSYDVKHGLCMIRSVAEKYGIDEVADLGNKMDKAVVWIGAKGWKAVDKNRHLAEEYGFADKFELNVWEEEEALDMIREYEESEKPFVFYCYEPSVITDKNYDLVMLDGVESDTESLHISYSKSLNEKYPEVVDYINNLELDVDMVNGWLEEDQRE